MYFWKIYFSFFKSTGTKSSLHFSIWTFSWAGQPKSIYTILWLAEIQRYCFPLLLYSGMNDYVSKCGLWTSTTSTAWELVRKANSLSSETSEVGSSNLCFNKHSQVTLMHTNVWVTLPYITYREIIKIYALLASNPFKKTSSI